MLAESWFFVQGFSELSDSNRETVSISLWVIFLKEVLIGFVVSFVLVVITNFIKPGLKI